MENGYIRVSCAGLARIKVDDKFVVSLNKGKLKDGRKVYTAIGGGEKFLPESVDYLTSLGFVPERDDDLRGDMPKASFPAFRDWYGKRIGRETLPTRELIEELVLETNTFKEFPSNVNIKYLNTAEESGRSYKGKETQRIFEIFSVEFDSKAAKVIEEACEKKDGYLASVTSNEILSGSTISGIEIGTNCIPLVRAGSVRL